MAGESLSMFPSGFKALKLYSQIPTDGVGDFTVIRAGNKTRRNSLNVTEVLSANVPSIDYTGGVTCPILLPEPQSTNLYLNMEVMVTQDVTVAASEYTVSFYGTGTITFTGTHTGSLVGTGLNDLVSITFTPSAGTLTSTISGTVTEGQIELGAYASSRIITTGIILTRLADVITGAGDVNTFNSTEGVLFVKMAALSNDENNRVISISDGTTSNRILLFYTSDPNQIQILITDGGAVQVSLVYNLADSTSFFDFVFKWEVNDCALWIDSVQVLTDIDCTIPSGLNKLSLDNGTGAAPFYGKIKQLKYYKSISEAQLDLPYIT